MALSKSDHFVDTQTGKKSALHEILCFSLSPLQHFHSLPYFIGTWPREKLLPSTSFRLALKLHELSVLVQLLCTFPLFVSMPVHTHRGKASPAALHGTVQFLLHFLFHSGQNQTRNVAMEPMGEIPRSWSLTAVPKVDISKSCQNKGMQNYIMHSHKTRNSSSRKLGFHHQVMWAVWIPISGLSIFTQLLFLQHWFWQHLTWEVSQKLPLKKAVSIHWKYTWWVYSFTAETTYVWF